MKKYIHLLSSSLLLLAGLGQVSADDTEIYRATAEDTVGGARPKVLIILDNSGSMKTTITSRTAYDPATTYPTQGSIQSGRTYWSTDGEVPDDDTKNYFTASANRCASSSTALGATGVGFYQDKMLATKEGRRVRGECLQWSKWGSCRKYEYIRLVDWFNLSSNNRDPDHVECRTDVADEDDSNPGTTDGFPSTSENDGPYGCSTASCSDVVFGKAYTLYSTNYMNWWHNPEYVTTEDRLEVAQKVLSDLVDSNTGVDFGLMIYNYNGRSYSDQDHNGGRVVHRIIKDMTTTDRTNLKAIINSTDHETYTPLCETSYEAFRYLTGKAVWYGDDKASGDTPSRDTLAESAGKYVSPLDEDDICQNVYVILMTDGKPTLDTLANDMIETLTGKTCQNYNDGWDDPKKSCLPELAEYMHTHDLDGDEENGTQKAIFYTIGFQSSQQLLEDTASNGGGKYYEADNSDALAVAFKSALLDIMTGSSSFTSPAVAVNTFDRTFSRDEIFLAMFEPKDGDRWPGNLKKLKAVSDASGSIIWKDKNNANAIDSATSNIIDSATTYWSTSADGPNVESGGAGQLLVDTGYAARTIKSNTGTDGALQTFESGNIDRVAYGMSTDAELFELFGVADQAALTNLVNWARGVDVADEDKDGDTTDTRPWILGDSLHSKPLAVNYGCTPVATCTPDIRVVLGTNEGFLHMFDSSDGSETWAFFAKELASVLKPRMDNTNTKYHTYGIDGPPVIYVHDANRDGYIDSTKDKVYLYFGLRRGGRGLYAMDITDPDAPVFKWLISYSQTGFSELGETWSTPIISTIPGHLDGDGNPKPVLIFGGGYDPAKDSTSLASADSMGRGIYIVDADTGDLIWSVTQDGTESSTHDVDTDLNHGIAAPVTSIDSNGDSLSDRIYAADTGGNVWRVDMPSSDKSTWKIRKLATLNGGDTANDRRFFNQPDVVRTIDSGRAYDAVLIGSGDRTNPLADDVTNRFYAIQDRRVYPYYDTDPTETECDDGSTDFRCIIPLVETNMLNVTGNELQDGTAAEQSSTETDLYNKFGWYITLENTGQKSLAKSLTIHGSLFFPTYIPNAKNANSCVPGAGQSQFFAVDVHNGKAIIDFNGDVTLSKPDRIITLGSMILETPSIYVGENRKISLFFPAGGTGGVDNEFINPNSPSLSPGDEVKLPTGTYWYIKEN